MSTVAPPSEDFYPRTWQITNASGDFISDISNHQIQLKYNHTESEIAHITAILVDAFKGDPFTNILLGGDLSLAPQQIRADVRAAFVGNAQVHVIATGPAVEDIVGVAIWYPPGAKSYSTQEERAAGFDEFQASVPASLRSWWAEYYAPTSRELTNSTVGSTYALNAWSLHLFGVFKTHQGKGHGRKLFEYAREIAKSTASPMVVKTTTDLDVKIYSRLGFKVCGGTPIKSPVGSGHLWLMNIEF